MRAEAGPLVPAEEFEDLYSNARFFFDFEPGGILKRLARTDAAARKLPECGVVPFHQKHFVVTQDNGLRNCRWVFSRQGWSQNV